MVACRQFGILSCVLLVVSLGALAALGIPRVAVGKIGGPPAPPIPVSATSAFGERANNSPNVVADPADPRFLALVNRLDSPDYSCALHVSPDAGRGWVPVNPLPSLPKGVEKCYGPEVAIDKRGRIHFVFLGLAGRGNLPVGVYFTTSLDRGRTFAEPTRIVEGFNFGVRMAVDPDLGDGGRIHLAWLHASAEPGLGSLGTSDNPILVAHSDDGGRSFSQPVRVSDPGRRRVVAPVLVLGPDHAVHVAYYDLRDDLRDYQGLEGPLWEDTWELVIARSFDGGKIFLPGVTIDSEIRAHERVLVVFTMPPVSLTAEGARICAAWTDARLGDADVFTRCSSNRGVSWQRARRVNDDPQGSGRWQYMPRVGLSPGGRLDVVYYDRREDAANLRNDVSYAFSYDGGQTFRRSVKLSTAGSSNTDIGQQYAVPSAGDRFDFGFRMALLSRRDSILAAWSDTHNSIMPTKAQDIFATVIEPPGPPVNRLAVGLAVLGTVVGVVGAAALLGRRPRAEPGAGGTVTPTPSDAV